MPPQKQTKVITRRRKFIEVEIPLVNTKIELVGENVASIINKTINLDLTRQLRGKSVEVTFRVEEISKKAVANPIKINLMPYFIRRMIRKRISYVEDSFEIPTQESLVRIKPFVITRKMVSNAVRRTLRNQTKNWLEDYCAERTDSELFNDILSNRLQKPLSLKLKKTYPLSLCEIRVFEIVRPLRPEEVPKVEKRKIIQKEETLDQFEEMEQEKIKEAEKEIKEAQERAIKVEGKSKEIETSGISIPESAQKLKVSDTSKNLGSLGKEVVEETEEKTESEKKVKKPRKIKEKKEE